MSAQIAHDIEETQRTADVQIIENVDFNAMLLSSRILEGLKRSGFKRPSPIQLKAIPMGRFGYDLIIKAKSGTGKTAVFGIIALEMVDVKKDALQVIILAPTREIAVQINQVLETIGSQIEGLNVHYFIGGTSVENNLQAIKKCHIAVAAPGRMCHLLRAKAMDLSSVRLLVLDEADELLKESFHKDINTIFKKLPEVKQIIATSATYPNELDQFLAKYMVSPVHISLDCDIPFLLGLKQFVSIVKSHLTVLQQVAIKTEELVRILSQTSFTQCMIFSNYQTRAESLSNNLKKRGWPTAYISAAQTQTKRLKTVADLKQFKCRILVTTDLTARGIDAANVDLVINIDVPYDFETYLHRMGRAGRYGSRGICITIAAQGADVDKLRSILGSIGGSSTTIALYPKDNEKIDNIWESDSSQFEPFHADTDPDEVVCEELKDLTVKEKDTKKEELLDKTIQELKSQTCTDNLEDFANCVDILLDNIHKEDEVETTEIKQKITPLDAKSKTPPVKKSQKKKIKTNEVCRNIPVAKEATPQLNKQFDSEAKLFQENIYNKNVALFDITKYLVEQQDVSAKDCESSVEKLLSIIKEEDTLEMEKLRSENRSEGVCGVGHISNYLADQSEFSRECENSVDEILKMINSEDAFEVDKMKNGSEVPECTCSADIFVDAYNYAVAISDKSWRASTCRNHKSRSEIQTREYVDTMELDQGRYSYELSPDAGELEEDIFVKAYDYAVGKPREEVERHVEHADESSSEAFGYVADLTHPAVQEVNYKKRKYNETRNPRIVYEEDFNRCADMLSENAPYFAGVEEFETYFSKWQRQVSSLKKIIFDDVYTREILSIKEKYQT